MGVTITPLDTCGIVRLNGGRFKRVLRSRDPLARAVVENTEAWSGGRLGDQSSVLFDTAAG